MPYEACYCEAEHEASLKEELVYLSDIHTKLRDARLTIQYNAVTATMGLSGISEENIQAVEDLNNASLDADKYIFNRIQEIEEELATIKCWE